MPAQSRAVGKRCLLAGVALLVAALGCSPAQRPVPSSARPLRAVAASSSSFDAAMRSSHEHDARADWRGPQCAEIARQFREAWRADPALREALYNASVAELRCHAVTGPHQQQLSSLDMRPRPYEGFVRLTPIASRRSPLELQRALDAANDANIASTGAPLMLANLASLHIERGYWSTNLDDATRDFASADGYLERAIMIDEHGAQARTQLVLLHLARAEQGGRALGESATCSRATATSVRADRACMGTENALELERALGVALQVVREHPTYAPARTAMGLVSYELRDTTEAVRQFALAAALQPNDVDAYTNLGGALLSAGGFEAAQRAYESALSLRADAYEAHLGRAVALGAQLDERHWRAQLVTVATELAQCKQIAPHRPEAYYHEAWFNLAREQRSSGVSARAAALEAGVSFGAFLAKAGPLAAYAREVQSARAKLGELRFLELSGN